MRIWLPTSLTAPPAAATAELVKEKQAEGREVCVIATPHGLRWFKAEEVERFTGHEVRHDFRSPTAPEFEPRGDAVLVAPATFNTLNKWALGINDTLALGLLNEALGRHVPIEVFQAVNGALASHPAYEKTVSVLRAAGVRFCNHDEVVD